MIPKKYVEYIPDEKGELYNGWFWTSLLSGLIKELR